MSAVTHAEIAANLLWESAAFFRHIGAENDFVEDQMNENAAMFEKVALLVECDVFEQRATMAAEDADEQEEYFLFAYFEAKIKEVKSMILYARQTGKLRWPGLQLDEDIDLQRVELYPAVSFLATFLMGMAHVLDLAQGRQPSEAA